MRFAKRVFLIAGLYGVVAVLPLYFMEGRIGRDLPPPITHPEFFYGFAGVGLAWQVAFLIIARDPVRFRPLMIPAVLEKGLFGLATLILLAQGRLAARLAGSALIDLSLGVLFFVCYFKTAPAGTPAASARA